MTVILLWAWANSPVIEIAPPPIPAPVRKTAAAKAPRHPIDWQRVKPAPRGAAVSVLAALQKPVQAPPPVVSHAPSLEDSWGIQVSSVRLAMGNSMVDLRYMVVNTEKAAQLAGGTIRAYIQDCTTGTRLFMVPPPKEGAFPPTGNRLSPGKTYFAMVGNKNGVLKSGNKVNIVVGDALVTNVIIE